MDKSIVQSRIGSVLNVDSINTSKADFLATHVPFRNISVSTRKNGGLVEERKQEHEIYNEIFENELTKNDHQFVVVLGKSGTGKSHFIRWMAARLEARNDEHSVVLLINRDANTLKGTIRQLLQADAIRNIANKEAYDRLVRADQAISETKFKTRIYHAFIEEMETDTSESVIGNTKRKKLIALFNDSLFKEKMMEPGGPIERIYSKVANVDGATPGDVIAEFQVADFILDVDFVENLEDADKKARVCAENLVEDHDGNEFAHNVTDYLNGFVENVIQLCTGIEPGDFQQIFVEIRRELKKQGKNLILLIEDITSFTGVNQALLNALITGHTGEYASYNMCKLISVIGSTSEYYNEFRRNAKDRVTKKITIGDEVIGENKSDLVQFVARYLNAVSLKNDVIEEWRVNGNYTEELPIAEDKEHLHWGSYKLSATQIMPLYPFSERAIVNLYNGMATDETKIRTPRYILRYIIEPAVNEIITSIHSFPSFCRDWRIILPESVENRIGSIVNSLEIPDVQKTQYRKRITAFINFWSNGTLDVTTDGCIGGISNSIYDELGFSEFTKKLCESTVTVSPTPNPIQPVPTEEDDAGMEIQPPVLPQPVQTVDPKQQKAYDGFKEIVISWHRDKQKLIKFHAVREQICKFIYDTINWQQENVPLDSKKLFSDAINDRLIGFERQDQALDKSAIILDDTDETYQLLLCFGKYLHLGSKSWNFPGSATAIYYATTWLERNKKKIVDRVRESSIDEIPIYVKAAIIQQLYKRIINGNAADLSISRFNMDCIFDLDVEKNLKEEFVKGHSQKWLDLQKYIYNCAVGDTARNSSYRYFNLIQGNDYNSKKFFLDYYLMTKAVESLKKGHFTISEDEKTEASVTKKRAILEMCNGILSRVQDVAYEEVLLGNATARKLLKLFGFEEDDEIEVDDIKNILDEIFNFYQKAFSCGANIQGVINTDKYKRLKNEASQLKKEFDVIQTKYDDYEDVIKILLAYSSGSVGKLQELLNALTKATTDVDSITLQMKQEIDNLTRSGGWDATVDPRFAEKKTEFEKMYDLFKEVRC